MWFKLTAKVSTDKHISLHLVVGPIHGCDSHHRILAKIVIISALLLRAIQSELNHLQRSSTEAVFGVEATFVPKEKASGLVSGHRAGGSLAVGAENSDCIKHRRLH